MGKETGEVSRVGKETSPTLDRFRFWLAYRLMNLAYRISWDGYISNISDGGSFGYCEDCDQRMPDEPSWCR